MVESAKNARGSCYASIGRSLNFACAMDGFKGLLLLTSEPLI